MNSIEDAKGVKVIFTTDFDFDASSGQKMDRKQLHVRTVFFGKDSIEAGFQGLTAYDLRLIEWSPKNLAGMSRNHLEEYLAAQNINELVIETSSSFPEDRSIKNHISVLKLRKFTARILFTLFEIIMIK